MLANQGLNRLWYFTWFSFKQKKTLFCLLIENFYFWSVFNVITRKNLLAYTTKYPLASNALFEWYHEIVKANFDNFNELKSVYWNASLAGDDRFVFNIMGNKYRLIVRIVFEYKAIQIKWFGTHKENDKIDVTNIKFKDI